LDVWHNNRKYAVFNKHFEPVVDTS
jgi:hypothetical protein